MRRRSASRVDPRAVLSVVPAREIVGRGARAIFANRSLQSSTLRSRSGSRSSARPLSLRMRERKSVENLPSAFAKACGFRSERLVRRFFCDAPCDSPCCGSARSSDPWRRSWSFCCSSVAVGGREDDELGLVEVGSFSRSPSQAYCDRARRARSSLAGESRLVDFDGSPFVSAPVLLWASPRAVAVDASRSRSFPRRIPGAAARLAGASRASALVLFLDGCSFSARALAFGLVLRRGERLGGEASNGYTRRTKLAGGPGPPTNT